MARSNWNGDDSTAGHVTTRDAVTRGEILDLAVTAVEGGIGYWAVIDSGGSSRDDHYYAEDATFTIVPDEHPTWDATGIKAVAGVTGPLEVNPEVILRGLERYCAEFDMSVREAIDSMDALLADCVIQHGLFGRIEFA